MPSYRAINLYRAKLSDYEIKEMWNFEVVYYLNTNSDWKPGEENKLNLEIGDHVNYWYEIKETVGKGAFGQVFKVFDHKE